MKKIIILLLCCGVLVSMAGCSGNTAPTTQAESPPTTVAETAITESFTETTPPVAAVEPTEKEKEPTSTESKEQAADPTPTTLVPTTKLKKETTPTVTTKPTEPSAAENTAPTAEEPPKEEEIYVGIQWPEVDPAEIERLVIKKVNAYRVAQGDTAATMLPGLTEVARYRATELTTNFASLFLSSCAFASLTRSQAFMDL